MRIATPEIIKTLRKSRKLTQEQLGLLSGMTKSQISKMENGTLGSEQTVFRLLDALGYRLDFNLVDKYSSDSYERDRILDILRTFKKYQGARYGIESMALFGSCARNEQTADSDVDILIRLKTPSLYSFVEISSMLESLLKRKVDLVSENARFRQDFIENIKNELIYV